ncbi:uncharacterized protein LOC128352118 isoform X2 [Hemicordylus capensis]|uniref:uncharacterized protein LOC128352118 isoform X2 n=1 Tax=Hemicordylus capensis TaxID=884348 RepID=UPI00230463E3|nr:uncharacterized protein LOC128352118 isoform X2 [Hemicordylus capensis]
MVSLRAPYCLQCCLSSSWNCWERSSGDLVQDVINMLMTPKSISPCQQHQEKSLNACLEAVMGWKRDNKLRLNPDKTDVLIVQGRNSGDYFDPSVLDGLMLPQKEQLLGKCKHGCPPPLPLFKPHRHQLHHRDLSQRIYCAFSKIGPGESFMNVSQLAPCGKKDDENSFPEAKMFSIICSNPATHTQNKQSVSVMVWEFPQAIPG